MAATLSLRGALRHPAPIPAALPGEHRCRGGLDRGRGDALELLAPEAQDRGRRTDVRVRELSFSDTLPVPVRGILGFSR
jgi:hypothetical protein